MSNFEILCVTMHQNDFSKIEEMNINSNVIFANQTDHTSYDELEFNGYKAKMISTETRGVGINRNLTLIYANAQYCLFADDDVVYVDDLEKIVVDEFQKYPDADVIVFNLDTKGGLRAQRKYNKSRKCGKFERMPWGTVRIAVRLEAVKKANVWFTTLFGGGCVFPSGEDSLWLTDAKRKGLKFYVSKETIGTVSFDQSTWFTGADERFYYGKGAFYQAAHPKMIWLWMLYFAFRTRNSKDLSFKQKILWMKKGQCGYKKMLSYDDYMKLSDAR